MKFSHDGNDADDANDAEIDITQLFKWDISQTASSASLASQRSRKESEQSAAEEERLAAAAGQPEQNHQSTTVHAAANGSYILTVPEFINLHNVEKNDLGSGLYTNDKYCKVNLRGNVCQDQSVMVTVTELDLLVTK